MTFASSARSLIRRRSPMLYLVATAGHPNYGDEVITRAWLDELSRIHPSAEVWLDCPYPGRVAHLFADAHPRLRVTSTLWELAHASPSHDPIEDTARIRQYVRDLGTPRLDAGLLTLRRASSIHLLGGGHLNDLWQDNLGVVAAVAETSRAFGIRAFATGLGLLPLSEAQKTWIAEEFSVFESVEARDDGSAAVLGVETGLDDAFLALDGPRRIFDERPSPQSMVLVQGDMRAWTDETANAAIDRFLEDAPAGGAGFVEAIPPDDSVYTRAEGRFYPFGHIWADGFPARPGQRWLTTRFHAHLLAAAAGAAGTVIAGRAGYYDHKHASLLARGTGWNLVDLAAPALDLEPTVDSGFPDRARGFAAQKRMRARELYRR